VAYLTGGGRGAVAQQPRGRKTVSPKYFMTNEYDHKNEHR